MNKISHGWAEAGVEARIAAHVHAWEKVKEAAAHPHEHFPFVTISREYGCEGRPLADQLVQILNERCRPSIPWVAYDKEVLDRVAKELNLARDIVDSLDGRRRNEMSELFDSILNRKVDEALMFRKLAEVVRSLATHGHVVIVGRGSYMITQDLKNGLHVRIVAPPAWRVRRVCAERGISASDGEKMVIESEKQREHFLQTFFVHDRAHPFRHDLVIDGSQFDTAQVAELVFTALRVRFGEVLVAA